MSAFLAESSLSFFSSFLRLSSFCSSESLGVSFAFSPFFSLPFFFSACLFLNSSSPFPSLRKTIAFSPSITITESTLRGTFFEFLCRYSLTSFAISTSFLRVCLNTNCRITPRVFIILLGFGNLKAVLSGIMYSACSPFMRYYTFLFFFPLFLCGTFLTFPCSACFFLNNWPRSVLLQCLLAFLFHILLPAFCCAHTGAFIRPGPIFFLLAIRKSLSSCSLFLAMGSLSLDVDFPFLRQFLEDQLHFLI